MNFNDIDKIWMQRALSEARKSADFGEVPVGAVITDGSNLLAASGNCPITSVDPTAHAEINVIREAALKQNNYRLPGATLYVTLEPCAMCMGAIIHARIQRLVFGAHDPKTGAAVSRYRLGTDNLLNHALIVQGGVLKDQCSSILQAFFRQRRS
jgi:tRNA(adenine34) deaminase